MTRLIFKCGRVHRRLANIEIVKHDGSIVLALVRSGSNVTGWQWNTSSAKYDDIAYAAPMSKTKRISIHTSGRVNFHGSPNPSVNFIPCLLDLIQAVPIVCYVIPDVEALDLIENNSPHDHVIELLGPSAGRLAFEFSVIAASQPSLPGEIWRFITEGHYGLTCVLVSAGLYPASPGLTPEAVSVLRPASMLLQQSITEEQAFMRFQELMHANQIRQALVSSGIPAHLHDQIIVETVREGRGIQGPNNEGVWEIVCNVPLRIRPELVVQFSDPRYRAEMIDMNSSDVRLEKIRVRFKVYDQQATRWVKHPVKIQRACLDAEL